ncbi:hypothetical protein K2173_005569 [Erythroxylum novogranatense]|uniref:Nucleotide-diphospho-sugar transferase domain-containing protein n=1 Tax=Erythroxylum novogranatense TaxID=1862640 RepID=A0AAV8SKD2_9ROSI|nr:hypothetical protein K2173_005569 [Erythroxylum novogranatense]
MHNLKEHGVQIVVSCLLFMGFLYVIFLNPGFRSIPMFRGQGCSYLSKTSSEREHVDLLGGVLAETAMENRTLIIAMVNKAYVEGDKPMLDVFLNSFWLGENTRDLVNHLLIVTVDRTSYERCRFLRLHCYKLETDGVNFNGEKLYMSADFIKMMWRRTLFLGDVLRRGYNFIFTDTDVLWLRNPFERLSSDESTDIQISTDNFNGYQWSEANPINTGFYIIRSNNKTISLFDTWYGMKDNSTGQKEQDVLNHMVREGVFRKLSLRVRFLDTTYFSGFCEDSRDIGAVTTVHANCCKTIRAKIADLKDVIRAWKRFRSSSTFNDTSILRKLNHVACRNSWKH